MGNTFRDIPTTPLKRVSDGRVVLSQVAVADTFFTRSKGLLGMSGMPKGHGLLITKTSSIHMFFMRFSLDIIYLDGKNRVVKVVRNIKPWRVSMARGAKHAVECSAGDAPDWLQKGDELSL